VDGSGRITGYGVFDLRRLRRCNWRLSSSNVWVVERALIRLRHRRLRTSARRYRATLRKYRAFREKYPQRPATFYASRHTWM
jgi:hypothetical protein